MVKKENLNSKCIGYESDRKRGKMEREKVEKIVRIREREREGGWKVEVCQYNRIDFVPESNPSPTPQTLLFFLPSPSPP